MTNTRVVAAVIAAAGIAVAQSGGTEQQAGASGADVPVKEKSDVSKWRTSVGVDYRFRFKTDLKMNAGRYNAAYPSFAAPQNEYPSRDSVLERIGTGNGSDARRDYDNGFVATDSGGGDITWNWSANSAGQYDAAAGTLEFDGYYGVTEGHIGAVSAPGVSDDTDLFGVRLDFAREIWRKDAFSVSVTVGGSYLPERELISTRQSFSAGSYRSEVWRVTDTYDVSWWGGSTPDLNEAGGLGTGTFEGPGPLIPYTPTRSEELHDVLADQTVSGGAWADADLWMAEGRLCLMPEWQVWDRLSLLGNMGVSIGYAEVSSSSGSWMMQNGTRYRHSDSQKDSEVIVQAILGLGVRFAVTERLGLAMLGEARLPRTEIDVDADPYEGEVELGTWNIGTQLEYCF